MTALLIWTQRTCQQYFLVTISDNRKGAILEKRSRLENARKKERRKLGFSFPRQQLLISIKAVRLAEQHANTYYRESVNTNDLCGFVFLLLFLLLIEKEHPAVVLIGR